MCKRIRRVKNVFFIIYSELIMESEQGGRGIDFNGYNSNDDTSCDDRITESTVKTRK